jgi:hypothetical protein
MLRARKRQEGSSIKRIAKARIDYSDLERMLRLPSGVKIVQIEQSAENRLHDQVVFYFEGEFLPEVARNADCMELTFESDARII